MSRQLVIMLAAVLLLLACRDGAGAGPVTTEPVAGFPRAMAALGGSLTAAYGSCGPVRCARNSWSTGDGTQVLSHYRRIRAVNPAISGRARNLAAVGAVAADLSDQAAAAVTQEADYVTLEIGWTDACRTPMTSASALRAGVDEALDRIKRGLPQARVLVVGLPDLYRIWEAGRTNKFVTGVWRSGGACPSLLANATSTAPSDGARREAFRDRVDAYNSQLAAACAGYGRRCRFASLTELVLDLGMVSATDFFHPNAAGQEALASQTYPTSFTW